MKQGAGHEGVGSWRVNRKLWSHRAIRAQSSVYLLICQSAPVDYSCLPHGDKLISAVRSLSRSSDRTREDTNWHSLCRKCAHNPSFGSKRFFEKVALTFRKLPSVARWCAEWNLDRGPTSCKAVLFFSSSSSLRGQNICYYMLFLDGVCWVILTQIFGRQWCNSAFVHCGALLLKKHPHFGQRFHNIKKNDFFSLNFSASLRIAKSYSIIPELHYSE